MNTVKSRIHKIYPMSRNLSPITDDLWGVSWVFGWKLFKAMNGLVLKPAYWIDKSKPKPMVLWNWIGPLRQTLIFFFLSNCRNVISRKWIQLCRMYNICHITHVSMFYDHLHIELIRHQGDRIYGKPRSESRLKVFLGWTWGPARVQPTYTDTGWQCAQCSEWLQTNTPKYSGSSRSIQHKMRTLTHWSLGDVDVINTCYGFKSMNISCEIALMWMP